MAAALVLFLPHFLLKAIQAAVNQPLQLPIPLTVVLVVVAIGLVFNGVHGWKRAGHADQGAKGEAEVAADLAHLTAHGWTIEYGTAVARWGDVDILCVSPQGRVYAIDVKSHGGFVFKDGNQLGRKLGTKTRSFEKDFLKAVKGQASEIQKQKRTKFVTPILVFSKAKVQVGSAPVQGVYVIDRPQLPKLLHQLG